MSYLRVLPTVYNLSLSRHGGGSRSAPASNEVTRISAEVPVSFLEGQDEQLDSESNNEFKLPPLRSLSIVILANALCQISFFIVVSSSNLYAQHLGGTSTFSGLVIGIPTVFSGLALIPLMRLDQGGYKRPLHFACATSILGHVLYAIAYPANWLYLILIGRIVSGFAFTWFMYSKRYCSDPRIVGIRRRTTLASWLVLGQGTGFSVGPFLGGLLYKIGFSNDVFNGFTSPAWLMAGVWACFWIVVTVFFEDVPQSPPAPPISQGIPLTDITRINTARVDSDAASQKSGVVVTSTAIPTSSSVDAARGESANMSGPQWGVTVTMCWFAMTCFFILGAWEANIPVYTGSSISSLHFSPFAAGNIIALGGICTFPFLFLNVMLARRVQDRHTLAVGTGLGLTGLLIAIAILKTGSVVYGSLFVCWFLVALGFNLASTVTLSLLSKQLPSLWNARTSLMIQYSNYLGRVTGAVWGGAGVSVGMLSYVGMQIAIVGVGAVMFSTLWKQLKAKTG